MEKSSAQIDPSFFFLSKAVRIEFICLINWVFGPVSSIFAGGCNVIMLSRDIF